MRKEYLMDDSMKKTIKDISEIITGEDKVKSKVADYIKGMKSKIEMKLFIVFLYRRLNDILKSEKCYPVIIAMHHPCFEPGGWLSEKILKNRELFNNIVTKYGVACVIYGHIHSYT